MVILSILPKEVYLPFGKNQKKKSIQLFSFCLFSEALTILSVHQAKTVKPTATKYLMQVADLKLHICTYIQVRNKSNCLLLVLLNCTSGERQ